MNNAMQLKAKVKNLATSQGIPAQAVLQNYMLERLLERISISHYKDAFILKGGMLIASMVGIHNRTTMDMDVTIKGISFTEDAILAIFKEICSIRLDDQVQLIVHQILPIREDDPYGGYRIAINARYAKMDTPLKVDLTTGDIITPKEIPYSYTSILEDKCIEVQAYNIETVLAEKVETILRRGVLNTRLRDYYDVFILSGSLGSVINPIVLSKALQATIHYRSPGSTIDDPEEIVHQIQSDPIMRQRWERYCLEYHYAEGISFDQVLQSLINLLFELQKE
jgi:predicted nucleotidyltransferase component of viral defense system